VGVEVAVVSVTVAVAGGCEAVVSRSVDCDGGSVSAVAVVAPRGGCGRGVSVTFLGTSNRPVMLNASIVSSKVGVASGDRRLVTQ